MTEKRYTTMWKPETTFSRFWIVRENWERKLNANDVVDLLNELHDENEQLKRSVQYWYAEHKRIVNNYVDKIKEVEKENEQLKQALREQLEENGNAYCIEILDKIFDLKYDEWQRKMNETHTYDYIDWENVLNDKGGVE